ncbi:MAG: hypothetical protein IJ074_13485, partial [Clostridia bacterium]|nr:hypothetical protein [Clostridia bacterium]
LSPVTPIPPIIPPEEKDALSARDAREASAKRETKARDERREWSADTEEERDDSFEQFWAAYPRKAGREGARRVWRKERLGKMADEIILAIERKRYSSDWTKENGRFIPYPQKYLTEHRWEDEQDGDWNAQGSTASDDEFDLVWGCYTEKDNELLRSCID